MKRTGVGLEGLEDRDMREMSEEELQEEFERAREELGTEGEELDLDSHDLDNIGNDSDEED